MTSHRNIEEKCVFAISPRGQGDGVPLLIIGIPAGGWDYMKDGKTHNFDLTKIGVPIKMVLFGAENHDAAMKVLSDGCAERGEAYLDERQADFSIEPVKPSPPDGKITRDPDYPVEYANLMAAFNRCADGSDTLTVLNASLQMLSAAIGAIVKLRNYKLEEALGYTSQVAEILRLSVRDNFNREVRPTDVPVKPS